MSTDPGYVRAQIDAAKHRAGQRQTRLLIIALLGLAIVASAAVAGFFISYSQARKNASLTKEVIRQGVQVKALAEQLTSLATAQAQGSEQGRATLKQIAELTTLIASFTDPQSQASRDRAVQTAAALRSLLAGQQIQNADLLRKLGEMAIALGAPPDVVKRILAEPAPPIVIPSVPPPPKPSSASGASVLPLPTVSPAINLQVQCPVICPPH